MNMRIQTLSLAAALSALLVACSDAEPQATGTSPPAVQYGVTFDPATYSAETEAAVDRCWKLPGAEYTGERLSDPPQMSGRVRGDVENEDFRACVEAIPGAVLR